MRRSTLALILILVVLTGSIVFVLLQRNSEPISGVPPTEKPVLPNTAQTVEKVAELSFSNSQIKVPPNGYAMATVVVDGKDKKISGVQVEARYDPRILSNVAISSVDNSVLGTKGQFPVLYSKVNPEKKSISYIAGLSPGGMASSSSGAVLNLSFKVDPSTTASETEISFLPTSMVMEDGVNNSILKAGYPLKIQIVR